MQAEGEDCIQTRWQPSTDLEDERGHTRGEGDPVQISKAQAQLG